MSSLAVNIIKAKFPNFERTKRQIELEFLKNETIQIVHRQTSIMRAAGEQMLMNFFGADTIIRTEIRRDEF